MRSLFSGVSGLRNQQLQMDIIGNNISNVNTVGFKASKINFFDLFSQTISSARRTATGGLTNPIQIGLGVETGSVDRDFSQGILQNTGLETDLGLQGGGFFVVGGDDKQFYTRAGNFHFDGEGRLVNSNGFFVKGWMADATGNLTQSAAIGNITFDASVISSAKSTANLAIAGNLNAAERPVIEVWTATKSLTTGGATPAVGTTDLNALDQTTTPLVAGDTIIIAGTDRAGGTVSVTYTYGTGAGQDGTTVNDLLTVISNAYTGTTATINATGEIVLTDDTFGNSSTSISLAAGAGNTGVIALPSFVNTTEGFTPIVTASAIVFDSLGDVHTLNLTFTKTPNPREWTFAVTFNGNETITKGSTGVSTFKTDGTLETTIYNNGETKLEFDPGNNAGNVSINLDFENTTGLSGLTQFVGPSTVNLPFQDGQTRGTLNSFVIDETGKIIGGYTNGKNRLIAQLAVGKFANPEGLVNIGNNLFAVSEGSGSPLVGKAGEDVETIIVSGVLEASNVDLADEFTEMIIAQRAFQASARIITVSDQFLQEVVQLKR